MPAYFLLHAPDWFEQRLRPALAASWRQHSLEPCRQLVASLAPLVHNFGQRYHIRPDDLVLNRLDAGLAFDRDLWECLAGELLLVTAAEAPELHVAPEALCHLLAPGLAPPADLPREQFAPVQQAHFGTRDLAFGGKLYRPGWAGFNDRDDVARLALYLASVDPEQWTVDGLRTLPPQGEWPAPDEDELTAELEFARQCFLGLVELYEHASAGGYLLVCETL